MDFAEGHAGRDRDIRQLFTATFAASEGAEEGEVIGDLVDQLIALAPSEDITVFTAYDDGVLVGGVFLSRMRYPDSDQTVFLLSPVAVRTDRQGTGVGQKLIAYGLDQMRQRRVDVVLTYGDPAYYSKSGFLAVAEDVFRPPFPLSQPQGWQAHPLGGSPLKPLTGASHCAAPFNNPDLW